MFILLCHSVRVKSEVGWYRIPQDNFFPSLSVMNPQETDLNDEYSQSPLLSGFWLGLANGQHQDTRREVGEFILLFPPSLAVLSHAAFLQLQVLLGPPEYFQGSSL